MGKNSAAAKKKNRISPLITIFALILFLAGAAVFLYPTVSNWLAERNQSDIVHQEALADANEDFYAAEWQKAREYNENLAGDPVHDPFVLGTGYALPENYLECLNINGVMGYIEIPKISIRLPIYHGTSEEVLQKGVGHIESTALPIGGEFSHTILTGHRGLPSAKLFTDLDQLGIGDRFYIHVLDQILAYEVDEINTVLPNELQKLQPIKERDLVTLITCTPYGVNTHRLLVRGTRVPYVPGEDEYPQTAGLLEVVGANEWLRYLGAAIGGILLLVMITLLRRYYKNKGDQHGR